MNVCSRFPFVRLLVPLIAGILLSYYCSVYVVIPIWILYIITISGVIFLLLLHFGSNKVISYKVRWIDGMALNGILVIIGWAITSSTFLQNQPRHFSAFQGDDKAYIARIIEQPIARQRSIKVLLTVTEIRDSATTYATEGNLLCYIKTDSLFVPPKYGDVIVFHKKPGLPEKPGNPGEFNYAAYLANQGIFHTIYLSQDDFRVLSTGKGNPLKSFALNTRTGFLNLLAENGLKGKELSVAAALLAGFDDQLDADQRREYAGAGVIHILCVSGLHVGVLFLLAEFAFSFLRRRKYLAVFKPVMIILVIWIYALITGMAPPVLRASLMFTLIIIGKAAQRQSNTFNTLALAAFILLILDPRLLFNVGFQLSFSAVAGIVAFQPSIRKLWKPVNPVIRYMWDLVTVSLAAQVFTAPLAVGYFHQFPDYFIISNLIAIPLSGIIIYTGLLMLFTSFIPFAGHIISLILIYELKLLNASVSYIEHLPGAVWDNIHLPGFGVILVIISMVSLFYWIASSRKVLLYVFLASVLFLVLGGVMRSYEISRQQMIVFHKVNRHPVISFIDGKDHIVLTDSILGTDLSKAGYQLNGLKVMAGLHDPKVRFITEVNSTEEYWERTLPEFFSFQGKRVVILSGRCRLPENGDNVKVDYVLLCNNVRTPIDQIAGCFPGASLIVDASNSQKTIERLAKSADESGLTLYNIRKSGALVVNLKS